MLLPTLVRRGYPLLLVSLVGLVASVQAWGVTRVLQASLISPAPRPLTAAPAAPLPSPSLHATSAERVASRNPFDSVRGNLRPKRDPETSSGGEPVLEMDPYRAPACADLRVVATAAAAEPRDSFAVLSMKEGQPGQVRRQGDGLSGGVVWFVGGDRVWMFGREGLCQAALYGAPPPARPLASAPPPPSNMSGALQEIAPKIRAVGPNEFVVERSALDRVKESYAELMRNVRVVPESEGGRTVGLRVFGIKPDTLLGVLGIQNGDRLEKLNGYDITSPESMLMAYAGLSNAEKLSLSLTRGGKAMQVDAHFR